ncbi:unnamed protein product [Oppiella nova]|uniref:Uncharacterized protein n=1 Tax=Oppiella nova TaxID=334625 RepID=A0A7R9QDD6_9ACAR|nr:unnamed protein product [Oppiella nova]CAG2163619.1 unnamed protein product [Oppiella nova]
MIRNGVKKRRSGHTYTSESGTGGYQGCCDSGFGHLLALSLNELGFRVYATVLDTKNTGSQELTKKCRFSQQMVVLKMDVTDDDQVRQVFVKVSEDLSVNGVVLWAVVNNAGYMMSSPVEWGTLHSSFEHIFKVNVFGVVRVTRVFLPLIKQAKGRVINTASVLALFAIPTFSAYCMTKASVLRFSDSLRKEMANFGVKVSTIMPGGFASTGLFTGILSLMDRTWAETEESVKRSYGQKYFDGWKRGQQKSLDSSSGLSGNNSYIVVNDIIDAIISDEPQNNYMPIEGFMFRYITFVNAYLPDSVANILQGLLSRRK